MAHEISVRKDGFAETAYVGKVGWHGLGNELKAGATIEEWQVAAGMDWRIQKGVVRYNVERGNEDYAPGYKSFPEKHVLFRSDTKAPLSIVSDHFKVVQPHDVLEFFRDLSDRAGLRLDTAGVLFGGKRFWALAVADGTASVGRGDIFKNMLLISTSCDGSMATEGRWTRVRVVCHNTLSEAREDGKAGSRTTHRSVFNPEKAKGDLGITKSNFAEFMADMRRLADTKIAESEVVAMTAEAYKPGAAKLAKEDFIKVLESYPVKTTLELVLEGKAKGSTLDGVKGTAYGWLNGVTEFVDHHARSHTSDNRVANAWFGNGSALKARAMNMALSA